MDMEAAGSAAEELAMVVLARLRWWEWSVDAALFRCEGRADDNWSWAAARSPPTCARGLDRLASLRHHDVGWALLWRFQTPKLRKKSATLRL